MHCTEQSTNFRELCVLFTHGYGWFLSGAGPSSHWGSSCARGTGGSDHTRRGRAHCSRGWTRRRSPSFKQQWGSSLFGYSTGIPQKKARRFIGLTEKRFLSWFTDVPAECSRILVSYFVRTRERIGRERGVEEDRLRSRRNRALVRSKDVAKKSGWWLKARIAARSTLVLPVRSRNL